MNVVLVVLPTPAAGAVTLTRADLRNENGRERITTASHVRLGVLSSTDAAVIRGFQL